MSFKPLYISGILFVATLSTSSFADDKSKLANKTVPPIDASVLEPDNKNLQPSVTTSGSQPKTPDKVPTPQEKALNILLEAATSENPFYRANAIEAMQLRPNRALPLTQKGLTDPQAVVRYTAAVTAGQLNFKSLIPSIRPLLNDKDHSVRAAAIYSLHSLGDKINISPLASLLRSQDARVRANTALMLGLLGDQSATQMLKAAAAAPLPKATAVQTAVTRIQIAEAVAKLGDNSVLHALRAGAYSPFGEVRVVAINAMGEVGDESMKIALQERLKNPDLKVQDSQSDDIKAQAELMALSVQVAAAGSLARMNDESGLDVVLKASENEYPVVRAQCAWSLMWFRNAKAYTQLLRFMNDENFQVRIAAAHALLKREKLNPGLSVGAK